MSEKRWSTGGTSRPVRASCLLATELGHEIRRNVRRKSLADRSSSVEGALHVVISVMIVGIASLTPRSSFSMRSCQPKLVHRTRD